tara:strand:+ start:1220 stop:1528 length:309 start_codon:yes stop_codon:yes gene_type:complete
VSHYPPGFTWDRFDRHHGTEFPEPTAPTITNQLGWECVTDHPDPNTRTTVGLVWDDAYRCFFLDVCERKFGRSADDSLEVPLSRDGLRALVELATRMLGDRT